MTPAGERMHQLAPDPMKPENPGITETTPMIPTNPEIIDTISQIIAVDGVLLAFLAFSMPALMYIICVFLLDVEQWSQ